MQNNKNNNNNAAEIKVMNSRFDQIINSATADVS